MSRKSSHCDMDNLQIVSRDGLAPQLVFRVYRGSSQIAFAQLSRGSAHERARFTGNGSSPAEPSISYCLKNVVVAQNCRGYGIGSALLDEVLDYCLLHRVARIYGEAKGDVAALKQWYRGKGFEISLTDEIRLLLWFRACRSAPARCFPESWAGLPQWDGYRRSA